MDLGLQELVDNSQLILDLIGTGHHNEDAFYGVSFSSDEDATIVVLTICCQATGNSSEHE